jgi:DNA-binding NarL/FixJ family response regulator
VTPYAPSIKDRPSSAPATAAHHGVARRHRRKNPRVSLAIGSATRNTQLAAAGLGNTTIAQRLGLSIKTVANHLSTIYRKIQVPDRPHAIVKARAAHHGDDSQHSANRDAAT